MKTKLLGLLAILPLLGLSPANAVGFTYAVDYTIAGDTVTGSITTTCDNCMLTTADVSAWNFSVPALSLSISGTSLSLGGTGDLTVSPSAITWHPGGAGTEFLDPLVGCVDFDGGHCGIGQPSQFDAINLSNSTEVSGATLQNLVIATATPLPAALPLFGTGLGVVGLLGWRRKRKAQAVAA